MSRLLPFRRRRRPENRLDIDDLYRRYAGLVQRRASRFFKDDNEAEEVVHEVFLKVIEKQDSFRREASPSTWLYAMTTNHCLNRLRNRNRRQQKLELNAELPWLLPASARDQETGTLLQQVWDQLDDEAVQVGTYYFIDGMTHAEIARIMGVSRRTIGNRIDELQARARRVAGIK